MGADVGNTYLEAETKEKLFIVAGEEFGAELHGHILIVHKALYGSRSRGRCWWDQWADVLKAEGFELSKGANNVWMCPAADKSCYEYIVVFVDNLMIATKDPARFIKMLRTKYNFKLKGNGPIDYHIGLNYSKDKDGNGTLLQRLKKFLIERMMDTYQQHHPRRRKHHWSRMIIQKLTRQLCCLGKKSKLSCQ